MPYAAMVLFQEKSAEKSLNAVFCRVQVAGSGERTRKKLYFTRCTMMKHAVSAQHCGAAIKE